MNNEKQTFINQIQLFLSDLRNEDPKQESLEWYLINNLKKYLQGINNSQSSKDVKRAREIFMRFYVESMNWDTELFKKCCILNHIGKKFERNLRDDS